jgi:hypothetical protein
MMNHVVLIAGLAGSVIAPRWDGHEAERPVYREVPDDPPGVPATALPGAPQARPVRRGPFASIQVNVDGAGANIRGDAANEPAIVVDPNDPLRMVIGWRQFPTITSNFRIAGVGYSRDGGRTWTAGALTPGQFRSDPVLETDSSGNFYYSSLHVGATWVQLFKSFDQGESWIGPAPTFGGDKQWLVVDRNGGVEDGYLYQAWNAIAGCCGTDTFTRSEDGGASWSTPSQVAGTPSAGTMALAADGTLYIAGADPANYATVRVARTASPGSGTPTFSVTDVDLGGAVVLSTGTSGPNPEGLLGQVDVGVDRSTGPNAGNVYVVCSVDPPGPDPMDVMFARSLDGGATWSPPTRLNDDAAGTNAWQWFATLAVAPDGRLDVIWNDTRGSGQDRLSELFYSSSSDGGVSWSANQALSPVFDSHLGWPNQNKLGDYYDMRADLVGADLAWAATFNGEQDVYYLRIGDYDCNQNAVGDALDISSGASTDVNANGIPDECESVAANYCTAGTTASGCRATLSARGVPSLSLASGFTVDADTVEGSKDGIFFYGLNGPQANTWGNGSSYQCVTPPVIRTPILSGTGTGGACDGSFGLDLNAYWSTAAPNKVPVAGGQVNLQLWHRDPLNTSNQTTSLSDALDFTILP